MRSRITISIGLSLLLVTAVIAATALQTQNSRKNKKTEGTQITTTLYQLPEENGAVPVELRCGDAKLSAPNTLESLPCVIKNNTDKFISAVTVSISITVEKDGELSPDTSFHTIETFVHPDMRAERRNNLISPRGERPIRDLLTSYDDAVIKGLTMQVDYVEFEDTTALGPNKAGSRIVDNIRVGAAKYKDWLARKYNQSGRSIDAVVALIESQPIPEEELGIENCDQQQGAVIYRDYARKTYETKGAEGLVKHLKQTSTSVNK